RGDHRRCRVQVAVPRPERLELGSPGLGEVLDVAPFVLDLFAEAHERLVGRERATQEVSDGGWLGHGLKGSGMPGQPATGPVVAGAEWRRRVARTSAGATASTSPTTHSAV